MGGIETFQKYAVNANYAQGYVGTDFQGEGSVSSAVEILNLEGELTGTQPIEILSQNFTGEFEKVYADDYYYRIWLIPRILDFGEIASTVSEEALIWNSFLEPVQLTTVQEIQSDNIFLQGIILNQNLNALATIKPVFVTDENGPETIDATYIFTFTLGIPTSINLVGVRSEPWPYTVDWAFAYEAEYEFKTDEIVSRSGKSQRRAIRNNPRRSLSYTATLVNYQTRELAGSMAERQTRPFTLTDESCAVTLENDITVGDTTTLFAYLPSWLMLGEFYSIEMGRIKERKQVVNVSNNLVTWNSPFNRDFREGSKVKKIVTVLLSTSQKADRLTDGTSVVNFSLLIPPGQEKPWSLGSSELLFKNREVWARKPDWVSGIEVTYLYPREELDYDRGIINYNYPVGFGTENRILLNTCLDYEQIERTINFFRRQKGRLGEFWVPSWEIDFVPVETIKGNNNNFLVEGTEIYKFYNEDTVHKAVYIYLKDGSFIFNQVLNLTLDNNNTLFTMTDNFIADIPTDSIQKIGWLLLSRFSSDTMSVSMLTDSVGQISYPITSLEVL